MGRYVNWRKPRGGVKKEDGTGRLCMHCGRQAVHKATRRTGPFQMDVWYCDVHAERAKGV